MISNNCSIWIFIEYGIEKLLRYLQKTLAVLLLPRLVLDSTANQPYLENH